MSTRDKSLPRAKRAPPFAKGGEGRSPERAATGTSRSDVRETRGELRSNERAAMDGRPGPEHGAGLQSVRVSLDLYTMQDGRVYRAALDFRTEQGERQCRERPYRMYGPDFW